MMLTERENNRGEPLSMLELINVSKTIKGQKVLDRLNLRIHEGEIRGILGDYASGKTVLAKILQGLLSYDGTIQVKNHPVHINSPHKAKEHGIVLMQEEPQLFDSLSVKENLAILLDSNLMLGKLANQYRKLALQYGLANDLDKPLAQMTKAEKKRIEFVACVMQKPKLIILDNPTKYLSNLEFRSLCWIMKQVAEQGCSVLYLTVKPAEIVSSCHQVTVIKSGMVTFSSPVSKVSQTQLENILVPNKPNVDTLSPKQDKKVMLRIQNITYKPYKNKDLKLRCPNLSFKSHQITSIVSNRSENHQEWFDFLSGVTKSDKSVDIEIDNMPIGNASIATRQSLGFFSMPENQKYATCLLDLSFYQNVVLPGVNSNLVSLGLLRHKNILEFFEEIKRLYKLKLESPYQKLSESSNSDIYRFLFGRIILQTPKVLILHNPTSGVDCFTGYNFLNNIVAMRNRGCCVIIVSTNCEQTFEISDQVSTIKNGRLLKPIDTSFISREKFQDLIEQSE